MTAEGEFAAQTAVLVRRLADENGCRPHRRGVWRCLRFCHRSAGFHRIRVREIVRQLALYTAQLDWGYRKRRYLYTPPLGYFRSPRGLVTRFYPPLFVAARDAGGSSAVPRTLPPPDFVRCFVERYRVKKDSSSSTTGSDTVTSDVGLHGLTFCLSAPAPDGSVRTLFARPGHFADAHLYTLVFEHECDRIAAPSSLLPAVAQFSSAARASRARQNRLPPPPCLVDLFVRIFCADAQTRLVVTRVAVVALGWVRRSRWPKGRLRRSAANSQ